MCYSIVVLTLVEYRRQHHVEVEQQGRLQAGIPSVGCALHGGCDASSRLALHVQQAHHHLVGAFLRGVAWRSSVELPIIPTVASPSGRRWKWERYSSKRSA